MNRKAQEGLMAVIGVLIIAAIVMIIAIFIYKKVFDVGREEFTEKECQASLELTRKFELAPVCFVKAPNPVALHCSRNFITVKDDLVMKNGDDATRLYDATCPATPGFTNAAKSPQACLAENVMAKSMASCWNLFFEGQLPVFQQWEIDEFDAKPDTNTKACFICAEITVATAEGVPEYGAYLRNAEYKRDLTYYDHFTSETAFCDPKLKQPTCWEGIASNQDGPLLDIVAKAPLPEWNLPKGKYAVAFVRRGMGTCEEKKVADGDAALTLTVQVIPVDKVSSFCDMVIV